MVILEVICSVSTYFMRTLVKFATLFSGYQLFVRMGSHKQTNDEDDPVGRHSEDCIC